MALFTTMPTRLRIAEQGHEAVEAAAHEQADGHARESDRDREQDHDGLAQRVELADQTDQHAEQADRYVREERRLGIGGRLELTAPFPREALAESLDDAVDLALDRRLQLAGREVEALGLDREGGCVVAPPDDGERRLSLDGRDLHEGDRRRRLAREHSP